MRIKSISIERLVSLRNILTVAFFFTIFFAPFLGTQAVTGPIVNAILFLAVIFLGYQTALWFSIFPSLAAIFVGILPLPMIFFVPFIITGNIIMVSVFNYFKNSFWSGVFLSAIAKFVFLSLSAHLLSKFFLSGQMALRITTLFGYHQLATAIVGGLIAYTIITIVSKKISF